jgi:AAHS family 4-hydroxybenzoate transporter-like MFS transporter
MNRAVSIESLIDESRIGRPQIVIVTLCALLAMADGFDNQAIAFAAPEIVKEFGIAPTELGAVFAAGSFGSLTGVVAQGPLGDRLGRKTVMLAAFVLIGVSSLLNVAATTSEGLIALRFAAGVGLGAALPNLFALTSEYTPKRRRSTFVTAMFCGIPLGSVLGGMATASILPSAGWRAVFYLAGALPLFLSVAAWALIPESLAFLVNRKNANDRIDEILTRIGVSAPREVAAFAGSERDLDVPSAQLFAEGRLYGTLLLSVISFVGLLVSISLTNWLPLILHQSGVTIGMAVIGGVVLSGGGILGAMFFALLTDAHDVYRILLPAYVAATLSIAAIGAVPLQGDLVVAAIFAAGFLFIGAQMCFPTLVAAYYPSALRATGIGWTMGAGRIGAIVGPAFTGLLVERKLATSELFYIGAATTLLAVAALALLAFAERARQGAPQ